jgi:pimeloyl-ACP methyl ester carboxylesterase
VLFSPAMMLGAAVAILTGTARLSPLARSARSRRHHWASRDEAFEQLRHRGVYKTWTPEALHAFVRHALKDAPDGGVELKCQPSREAEVFASAPERLWTLLGRIETPTLVVHADHTFPFVLEGAARLRRVNRHVQTQEVSGTHCFMQEQPANTAAQVKSFLLSA